MLKKDIIWSIDETVYHIRNVPYIMHDDEEYLDLGVSFRIMTIRDLMVQNEIPHNVNYEDVADIIF